MADRFDPILRAENLRKTYHLQGATIQALCGLDLTIRAGEFVAIMGPSGSGKSTLLNLLGGLDEPTGGLVYLNGHLQSALDENARADLRRKLIGFVFQSFDLLPLLTVQQNVEFPLAVAGIGALERRERASELLDQMSLSGKKDALPDELSGGQKQRVAIARALANQPSVIFADEPTGSLDSLTATEVLELLHQVTARKGMTLVMVTHDEEDAGRADRIIRLRDGRIEGEVD